MGFDMDRELLVRERKYIWEIMVCHYTGEHIGEADAVSDTSLWYFPDLLTENDNSILMPYLELALEKQNFVYERIRGSEDPRIEETENRIRRIEHLIEEVR
jgi:tRNA A22 N-methylase